MKGGQSGKVAKLQSSRADKLSALRYKRGQGKEWGKPAQPRMKLLWMENGRYLAWCIISCVWIG
ncbi:MAG: hypothetical protein M5U34_11100 [Chloroflexi bacterium]|nr:hypothetical protein [Chloroflexota bacterium]